MKLDFIHVLLPFMAAGLAAGLDVVLAANPDVMFSKPTLLHAGGAFLVAVIALLKKSPVQGQDPK